MNSAIKLTLLQLGDMNGLSLQPFSNPVAQEKQWLEGDVASLVLLPSQ